MVEYIAGGEALAEMRLGMVVKECATWRHTVKALVGASSALIGDKYLVGDGMPRLIDEASNAPGPVHVYVEMESRWVWCLCLAKTTRIADWRQWVILVSIAVIVGLFIAVRLGEHPSAIYIARQWPPGVLRKSMHSGNPFRK